MTIQPDLPPLRVDEHGVIRVGDSRVTLDTIIAEYKNGACPERIADEYDTLQLADIYAAITYYLRHPQEISAYLERRGQAADAIRRKVEAAGSSGSELAEVIRQRWQAQGTPPHAPPVD